MYDDEDDDDEADFVSGDTSNVQSGWAGNSVQAGNVHGDIHFHAHEREYLPALPGGFSVAVFVALFLIVSAYAHAVSAFDLSFWGWVRLILSTFLVVPVFLATEYRLHGDEFLRLRALGAVVVIALAASEGPGINALAGVVDLLARWLVWRF